MVLFDKDISDDYFKFLKDKIKKENVSQGNTNINIFKVRIRNSKIYKQF